MPYWRACEQFGTGTCTEATASGQLQFTVSLDIPVSYTYKTKKLPPVNVNVTDVLFVQHNVTDGDDLVA